MARVSDERLVLLEDRSVRLTEVKRMVQSIHDNIQDPVGLYPSRELLKRELGHIIRKCENSG